MAELVLGPVLRHVGETEATIWLETSAPCEVEILGHRDRTFCVGGHHYALLVLRGLARGAELSYTVAVDGGHVWPPAHEPESLIRTRAPRDPLRLSFGSCRVSVPHEPPFSLRKDDHDRGREVDALAALADRMRTCSPEHWPDALLWLGDQVYADECSPAIVARIGRRRALDEGAGREVADFEEYTWLYRESWADPKLRWLLSTVPSSMIFDDHDVHDDWNTSGTWVRAIREQPWWRERILGAYATYWLYQHLGNLSPDALEADELLRAVRAHEGDAIELVRAFAERAEREVATTRWSYVRDFGRTRLVVLDSRAGRIVDDDRHRQMLADEQWDWVAEQLTGDVDHLLIATSLPLLLAPGLHHLESWNEAVCAGAWGGLARRWAEKLRQGVDLEHWPAFHGCFDRLVDELRAVGSGERGEPPASIAVLSGDVHHAYLAEVGFPRAAGVRSAVVQATCSPVRNPLDNRERTAMRAALSRPAAWVGRLLARSAGVPAPAIRWRFPERPTFDNQVATLELDGRSARMQIERTEPDDWEAPRLHMSLDRVIA